MRWIGLVAALICGGCDGGIDDTRPDFAFPYDMINSSDLAASTCPSLFAGFAGASDVERRVACACGCTIDPLLSNMVAGFWATPTSSGAGRVVPVQNVGLEIDIDTTASFESAGIASTPPVAPFYLDGDFQLSADYALITFTSDARVEMVLATQFRSYSVERARTAPGENLARAKFSAVEAGSRPDSAPTGTLQLERMGTTVIASANGVPIAQTTSAGIDRLSLYLGAARGPCAVGGDAGACGVAIAFKNVRMTGGALVDRR